MFGNVPEHFYGLVGRIALLAGLLEDRLHVLFCVLENASQDQLAGEPGTELIKECQRRMDRIPDSYRDDAEEFLLRAEAALRERHSVLHSLWPFSDTPVTRGRRTVPRGRRQERDQPVEWTQASADELPNLVTDLVGLVSRCRQVEGSAGPLLIAIARRPRALPTSLYHRPRVKPVPLCVGCSVRDRLR